MRTDALDYDLPDDRIAQEPLGRRDRSRLLVLERTDRLHHRRFDELPEILRPGDLVVLNDARVLPARLWARRATGGRTELLLVRSRQGPSGIAGSPTSHFLASDADSSDSPSSSSADRPVWRALARPAGRLRVGERLRLVGEAGGIEGAEGDVEHPEDSHRPALPESSERTDTDAGGPEVEILEKGDGGAVVLGFPAGTDVEALLERRGEMPLPPYIERDADDPRREADRRRYQTVYARRPGAVAAPTAGLHFTDELLDRLRERRIEVARLTLDVGPGTFRPVTATEVEDHEMEAERYRIPGETAAAVETIRTGHRDGRVVAVGTSVVRALEHSGGAAGAGEADLFITPGYEFAVVDALLTNFHLPRSTPLLLAAAFAGIEALEGAYREAIRQGYRFYSYGDAMLVL